MTTPYDLEKLSKELRDMPRHLWDEHLMSFCEALLMEHSGSEQMRNPVNARVPAAKTAALAHLNNDG